MPQIKSKPEVLEENKIKACQLIGSAWVDPAISQLVNVKCKNKIDLKKKKRIQ